MRRRLASAAVAALAATTLLPTQSAEAAANHVGIVVRFPNGSTSTACVSVGGNGYAILKRGKYQLNIGTSGQYAGFLLQINSQPTSPHPDNTHYWSYWHASGNGRWTYSSVGAASYTPKAGTVDGWSYVNGTSTAPPPPKRGYAALCGALDPKPAPPPATHPAPASSTTHHAAASPHTAPRASVSARRPGRPPTTTRAPAMHGESVLTSAASAQSPAPHESSPTVSSAPAGAPAPSTSQVAATRTADPQQKSSGFPAWGTVVALVVVAALGVGAWLRIRRQTG